MYDRFEQAAESHTNTFRWILEDPRTDEREEPETDERSVPSGTDDEGRESTSSGIDEENSHPVAGLMGGDIITDTKGKTFETVVESESLEVDMIRETAMTDTENRNSEPEVGNEGHSTNTTNEDSTTDPKNEDVESDTDGEDWETDIESVSGLSSNSRDPAVQESGCNPVVASFILQESQALGNPH